MLKAASEKIAKIADRMGNIEIGGWCSSALLGSGWLIDHGMHQMLGQDADPKRLMVVGGTGLGLLMGTLALDGVRSGYRYVERVLMAESRRGYLQGREVGILESSRNLQERVSPSSKSGSAAIGMELIMAKISYDKLPESVPLAGKIALCSFWGALVSHEGGNILGSRLALRMANKMLKPAVDEALKAESQQKCQVGALEERSINV